MCVYVNVNVCIHICIEKERERRGGGGGGGGRIHKTLPEFLLENIEEDTRSLVLLMMGTIIDQEKF